MIGIRAHLCAPLNGLCSTENLPLKTVLFSKETVRETDAIDIVLGYDEFPTGASLRHALFYQGDRISIAHSLGTLDAAHLMGSGLASDVTYYAVPFGKVVPTGWGHVDNFNDWGDAVNGFFFGNILNPGGS